MQYIYEGKICAYPGAARCAESVCGYARIGVKRSVRYGEAGGKDLLLYENTLWAEGYTAIAGIDEAGRGPLAGSVYAAAVILPQGCRLTACATRKKLSEKKARGALDEIVERAVAYGIYAVDSVRIDEINILRRRLKPCAAR